MFVLRTIPTHVMFHALNQSMKKYFLAGKYLFQEMKCAVNGNTCKRDSEKRRNKLIQSNSNEICLWHSQPGASIGFDI